MMRRAHRTTWCACALLLAGVSAHAATPPAADADIVSLPPSTRVAPKAVVRSFDANGIVVVEYGGDYARGNFEARAAIAREYFAQHVDDYDFLFAFSTFEFETGGAAAFANLVKNDTQGIGLAQFDNAAAFGSASGRLQVFVDMAALARWNFNPAAPAHGQLLDAAAHETLHRWVAHPLYAKAGANSEALLSRDRSHWSFFLDTDASLMYGADWREQPAGQFEAIDIRHRLAPLDLYLAGLYAAAEVPPLKLITGGADPGASDLPQLGYRTAGTAETIDIAQIVAANGARVPDVASAPRRFKAGLLLIARPGEALDERITFDLARFAQGFEQRFAALTRGRAAIAIDNRALSLAAAGAPEPVRGSAGCTSCVLDTVAAGSWLVAQQDASGAFADRPGMALHDTAAALRTTVELGTGAPTVAQRAHTFLAGRSPRQLDDLAWLKLDREFAPSAEQDALIAGIRERFATTGAGLDATYAESPIDLALSLRTAYAIDFSTQVAFGRLRALQQPDGSFGATAHGASHIATSAFILRELASLHDSGADSIATSTVDWLLSQRRPGGGLGDGDSVLASAWLIEALLNLDRGHEIAPSLDYLRNRQGTAGDWNGSVLTTAEVLRAASLTSRSNVFFERTMTASPAAPIPGDVVRLSARVHRDGPHAPLVGLAWYDGAPGQGGTPIGAEQVLNVPGGQSIDVGIDWPTAGLSGVHHLYAVLDPADEIIELNELDNRALLDLDIGQVPNAPDAALLRELVSVDPPGVSVYPATVHLHGRVRNFGGAPLDAVALALYSLRDGSRTERARTALSIAPVGEATFDLALTIERGESLQLALVVDPDNLVAEVRETNNELRFDLALQPGIDLVVRAEDLALLTAPAVRGVPVQIRATVRNNGATDSDAFALGASIDQGSTHVDLTPITMQLAAGASAERTFTWTPAAIGPATFHAVADPAAATTDIERGNNSAVLQFEVVEPGAPNLVVESESLALSPTPLDQAQPASLHAVLRNMGAATTADLVVEVSTGAASGARTVLARGTLAGGLALGASGALDIALPPLAVGGERYFFASVDPDHAVVESNEDDNTAFVRAHVRSLPDAAVTIASVQLTPTVPIAGQPVRADVHVLNLGEQPLDNLQLALYEGDVATGTPVPGGASIAHIDGGAAGDAVFQWTFGLAPGAQRISVAVDPAGAIDELREDNNLTVAPLGSVEPNFATEPYFSPNGDGIKDTTEAVFREVSGAVASIEVRDAAEHVVRRFAAGQFAAQNGASVVWDGRADDGLVALDGDYRLQARNAAGTVLAEVGATLDTNRSSILEAVGTALEHRAPLLARRALIKPPAHAADQDSVLLIDPENLETSDPDDRAAGVYRYDVLLQTLDPLIDGAWLSARGPEATVESAAWVGDGRFIVFRVSTSAGRTLWKTRVGVRNAPELLDSDARPGDLYDALDDRTLLVWRPDLAPVAQSFDLDSNARTTLRTEGVPSGFIATTADGVVAGLQDRALAFVSRDPAVAPSIVLTESENAEVVLRGAQGALIHTLGGRGAIEWRSLRTAQRRTVVLASGSVGCDFELQPVGGAPTLAVVDSPRRSVHLVDVETGAARAIAFPPASAHGAYQAHYYIWTYGETDQRLAASATGSSPRIGAGCVAAPNAAAAKQGRIAKAVATGLVRHVANLPVVVELGEQVNAQIDGAPGYGAVVSRGATDAYLLDPADGSFRLLGRYTDWPLVDPRDRAAYPSVSESFIDSETGPGDVSAAAAAAGFIRLEELPQVNASLVLRDGSGLDHDYRVFLANDYLTGATLPPESADVVDRWADESHLLLTSGSDLTVYASLANQTTRLVARGRAEGIRLQGIAGDRNFQQFELEWADSVAPDLWHPLGPAVLDPVLDGELQTFAPPAPGQYLVRLHAIDRAGNETYAISRALSPVGADIANASIGPQYFSPNGDGTRDELAIAFDALRPTTIALKVRTHDGALVYSRTEQVTAPGPVHWTWDGRGDNGLVVRDGSYRVEIGPWFSQRVTVDTVPPDLSVATAIEYRIQGTRIDSELFWETQEHSPLETAIERGVGASPTAWLVVARAAAAGGRRRIAGDDPYNYRVSVVDLAGNRTQRVRGLPPAAVHVIGHHVLAAGADGFGALAWGCDIDAHGNDCDHGGDRTIYAAPGDRIALDLWISPPVDPSNYALTYQPFQRDPLVPLSAPESLAIVAQYVSGAEYRLTADLPALPHGTEYVQISARLITAQAQTLHAMTGFVVADPTGGSLPPSNSDEYLLDVRPHTAACGEAPAELIDYHSGIFDRSGRHLTRFRSWFMTGGTRHDVFDLAVPQALDVTCYARASCPGLAAGSGSIDTRGLPQGKYYLQFAASFDSGGELAFAAPFYVERQQPVIEIAEPREGQRTCATAVLEDSEFGAPPIWRVSIPIRATISDPFGVARRTLAGPTPPDTGLSPAGFEAPDDRWIAFRDTWSGPLSAFAQSGRYSVLNTTLIRSGPRPDTEQVVNPAFDSTGHSIGPFHGPAYLQVGAVNWSGAPVCRTVHFIADIGPEYELENIESEYTRRHREPGHPPPTDIINPLGPVIFRALTLDLVARESLQVRMDLFPYLGSQPIGVVSDYVDYGAGRHALSWAGRLSDGTLVDDGIYDLMLTIRDGCGIQITKRLPIALDTTAPQVNLAEPHAADVVSGPLVAIRGDIVDAHQGSLDLSAELDSIVPILATHYPNEDFRTGRVAWNRGDRSGPAVIKLVATDDVGNATTLQVPITLTPRATHLIDDASVVPGVFSPNGDGALESTLLRYALARNADVSVRVLHNDESLLTVLRNAEPTVAGNRTLSWLGEGLPPTGRDGRYLIELHAVDASNAGAFEDVRIPVEVDTTAPVFRVLEPAGEYSRGTGPLRIELDEPHFGGATWRIDADPIGALPGSGATTLAQLDDLAEGPHTLALAALDAAGNPHTLSSTFTIDRIAPVATIAAPAENAVLGGAATTATVTGSASDANLRDFALAIAPASAPQSATTIATGSTAVHDAALGTLDLARADGDYLLRLRVTDRADRSAETTRAIAIDRTPPVVAITAPAEGAQINRALVVTGSATDAHLVDYRIRIATADQAGANLWSDLVVATSTVADGELARASIALPDGDYVLAVVATDAVGLATERRVRVRLDSEAPPVPLDLVGQRDGADAALHWSASNAADLAGYYLYRDGARLNATPLAATSKRDVAPPEGRLRYEVSAVDRGGNESARSNAVVIAIDRTPPRVAITVPADGARVAGRVETLGTAFSSDDFERYTVRLEGIAPPSAAQVLADSTRAVDNGLLATWSTQGLPEEARFRISLDAVDTGGNHASVAREVVVDNLAPAAPTGLAAVLVGADGQVSWSANAEPDLLGYVLLRDGVAVNASGALPRDLREIALATPSYVDVDVPDGAHAYIVFAIDRAGNLSVPSTPASLDVSHRPPHLRLIAPTEGQSFGAAIGIEATSVDTDIAEVRFDVRAVAASDWTPIGTPLAAAPYRATWTPGALPHGDYVIRARATDTTALDDPSPPTVTVRYTEFEAPPQVTGVLAVGSGGDAHITWNASTAPDVAGYFVERRYGDDWRRVNDDALATTELRDAALEDGDYAYRVVAIDASGNESTPSAPDTARVFTLVSTTPFSPTRAATTALTLRSPRAGTLAATQSVEGGAPASVLALPIAADVALDSGALALPPGESLFALNVTTAHGDRSRDVLAWVTRGDAPAAPTGLALALDQHDVAASWNANPEANIAGYRLHRRDFPVQPDEPVGFSVGGVPSYQTYYANDTDFETAWLDDAYFAAGPVGAVRLDLDAGVPRWFTAVDIDWRPGRAPAAYRVEGDSGRAFVTLAEVADDAHASQHVVLAAPYWTQRLRIVPTRAAFYGASIALAEVRATARPLIAATTFTDSVVDGHYDYRVSAVNTLGFESARSSIAEIDVGDVEPPQPVVLTGAVDGRDAALSWSASASLDVARYDLQRDGVHLVYVAAPATSYRDANRPNGGHDYRVIALDAFDNRSAPSNVVHLDFAGALPGVPQNLRVAAPPSGAALALDWQAGGGAPSVTYRVRRSQASSGPFVQIGTTTSASYLDQPLTNGTTYWYTVEALDAAGNASGQSAPASGAPRDTQPPDAPFLGHPVLPGATVVLDADAVVLGGEAEPGAQIEIGRGASVLARTPSRASDASRVDGRILHPGYLHADPGGRWVLHERAMSVAYDLDGGDPRTVAFEGFGGWTRDARLVEYGLDQDSWSTMPVAPGERRSLVVPVHGSGLAVFSSDLRFALMQGTARIDNVDVSGTFAVDLVAQRARPLSGVAVPAGAWNSVAIADEAALAAWRTGTGDLVRVDLRTGAGEVLAHDGADARVDIDRSGGEVLYVKRVGGLPHVYRAAADGTSIELGEGGAAAYAPSGERYALARLDGRIEIRARAGDSIERVVEPGGGALIDLQWTASGRIVAASADQLFVIDPAGTFRVAPVALVSGDNAFVLRATDAAGLVSVPSVTAHVSVPGAGLPDLAIAPIDIRFVPSAGAPGASYAAQVAVRNAGALASAATTVRLELVAPNGAAVSLPAAALAPLPPNASASFGVALGTLAQTGAYMLTVTLDPDEQVHERDETNNRASARLVLAPTAQPSLELVLDAGSFAPGQDVSGTVAVVNGGALFSGRVRLRVLAADASVVADLGTIDVASLAFGQRLERVLHWAATNALAGDYAVVAELSDSAAHLIETRRADFRIGVARNLALAIAPDRASYAPGDTARLSTLIDFRSGNAPLSAATLRVAVLDPLGAERFATTRALATMLPGYRVQLPASWTAAGAPGVYALRATLSVANVPIATADASLALDANTTTPSLRGELAPTPSPLIAGRAGAIAYALVNPTASAVQVDELRVRLLRGAEISLAAQGTASGSAPAGGRLDASLDLTSTNLPLGAYLALLDAQVNGESTRRVLAVKSVAVVDGEPPAIDVRVPADDAWVRAPVAIAAAIADLNSGLDRAELELDGGGFAAIGQRPDGLYGATLTGLAEGAHRFRFRATDRAGNVATGAEHAFQLDSLAPQIAVTGIAAGGAYNHAVAAHVVVTEANLDATATTLDGAAYVSDTPIAAEGAHALVATARDRAGNAARVELAFAIDTTAPTLAFTAPAAGLQTTTASVDVRLLTEPGARVALSVGGYAAEVVAGASGIAAFDGVPLAFGANTLAADARDALDNRSASITRQVTRIDDSASELSGSLIPSAPSIGAGDPVALAWQVNNTGNVARNNVTLGIRAVHVASQAVLGDTSFAASVPAHGSASGNTSFASTGAPLGHYVATLSAQTLSGPVQLASADFDLRDNQAPTLLVVAPQPAALLGTAPRIVATATDALGVVTEVAYSIDGAPFVAMPLADAATHRYESAALDLPDGAYGVRVRATDDSTNAFTTASIAFEIDRTAPAIGITGVSDGGAYNHAVAATITVTDAHPGTNTALLDGAAYVSGASIAADGAHHLQVDATDAANNPATRTLDFVVDTTAPTIAFTVPAAGAVLPVDHVDVTGLTEALAQVDFRNGAASASVSADAQGGFVVPAVALALGANHLELRAHDALDNTSAWIARDVEYRPNAGVQLEADLTPASTALPLDAPLELDYVVRNTGAIAAQALPLRLRLVHVADSREVSSAAFALDLAPAASTNGARTLATTGSVPGAHLALLEANLTSAGGASAWQTLASASLDLVDVVAPSVSITQPGENAYVGATFTVHVLASDASSALDAVEVRVDGGSYIALAPGAAPNEFVADIAPAHEGALVLAARAQDAAANVGTSADRHLVADLLPPQIAISGASEGQLSRDPLTLTVTVTDASPTTRTIELDGTPFVSGTTVSAEGAHALHVIATDTLARSTTRDLNFTIDRTAPTVHITAPADGAIIFAASTLVAGTTEPGASVAIGAGAFSGSAVAGGDGVFSLDNVPLATGNNTITARATDAAGNIGANDAVTVERRSQQVAGVAGDFDPLEPTAVSGQPMVLGFSLRNTGNVALTALPVRVAVYAHAGHALLGEVLQQHDLAIGASKLSSASFNNSSWGLIEIDVELSATLPGAPGAILLDQTAIGLVQRDIFKDGFETPPPPVPPAVAAFDADAPAFVAERGTGRTPPAPRWTIDAAAFETPRRKLRRTEQHLTHGAHA